MTARRVALVVAASSTLLGVLGALALILHLDGPFLALHERAFLPRHEAHGLTPDLRLGQSIGFGFWAGLSLVQSILLATLEDRALVPVARAFLAGHVLWYLLDSGGSAASGAWVNVGTNTLYAVALGVPLAILARLPRQEERAV